MHIIDHPIETSSVSHSLLNSKKR